MINPPKPPFFETEAILKDVISNDVAKRLLTLRIDRFGRVDSDSDTLNVITRTFKRPRSFAVCRDSIMRQTYPKINHIVGSEVDCCYFPCEKLSVKEGGELPWNLHLNDLGEKVDDGWVMYLDDDDMFSFTGSAEEIMSEIEHEDQILLWKVGTRRGAVPSDEYFGKDIVKGQISGIGVAFHSKHLPVPWDTVRGGDYKVIKYLSERLEVKWIDKVLTKTQRKNNKGCPPVLESKSVEILKLIKFSGSIASKPDVSVIIPFKDDHYLIKETIGRINNGLNPSKVEIIIVDDGSFTPLEPKHIGDHQNVTILRNHSRKGVGFSFDRGVIASHGDVLLLMGSDVYLRIRS
jgi:hypothetical protein